MIKEHAEIIEGKRHLMTDGDVRIIEKREMLLKEMEQIERLLYEVTQSFRNSEHTLKTLINEKKNELHSLCRKCSGHVWDKEEPDSMGNGMCVICGYDDY